MPTYLNTCPNGHKFESIQRITDKPVCKCIECGAKTKRLIQGTSFVLNGGGWFRDGYRSTRGGKK